MKYFVKVGANCEDKVYINTKTQTMVAPTHNEYGVHVGWKVVDLQTGERVKRSYSCRECREYANEFDHDAFYITAGLGEEIETAEEPVEDAAVETEEMTEDVMDDQTEESGEKEDEE